VNNPPCPRNAGQITRLTVDGARPSRAAITRTDAPTATHGRSPPVPPSPTQAGTGTETPARSRPGRRPHGEPSRAPSPTPARSPTATGPHASAATTPSSAHSTYPADPLAPPQPPSFTSPPAVLHPPIEPEPPKIPASNRGTPSSATAGQSAQSHKAQYVAGKPIASLAPDRRRWIQRHH